MVFSFDLVGASLTLYNNEKPLVSYLWSIKGTRKSCSVDQEVRGTKDACFTRETFSLGKLEAFQCSCTLQKTVQLAILVSSWDAKQSLFIKDYFIVLVTSRVHVFYCCNAPYKIGYRFIRHFTVKDQGLRIPSSADRSKVVWYMLMYCRIHLIPSRRFVIQQHGYVCVKWTKAWLRLFCLVTDLFKSTVCSMAV